MVAVGWLAGATSIRSDENQSLFINRGTVTVVEEIWGVNDQYPLGFADFVATDVGQGIPTGRFTTVYQGRKYLFLRGGELWIGLEGTSVSTTEKGDELHFTFVVEGKVSPPGKPTLFQGEFQIVGGTGRFQNSSGGGVNFGSAMPDGVTFTYRSFGLIALGDDD